MGKTYPNGKVWYQGTFKDDKPVGELKRYNDDGSLKSIQHYSDNGQGCYTRMFYQNGVLAAEGIYSNNAKDSVWKYYSFYDKTVSLIETFDKGVKNGLSAKYYPSGRQAEKVNWVNGKREGEWLQYYDSGLTKFAGNYTNDKLNGRFLYYFTNGRIEITGQYKDNLQDGIWQYYTIDGTLHMTLKYKEGQALDADKLDEQQREYFKMVEKNMGTIQEPDENSLMPGGGK